MISIIATFAILAYQPIQLERGIVRIPELIAEIATKSGETLTAAASLKNEVLYVNLQPRDVKQVMSLVAEVSGCEWVKRDHSTELTRTASKLHEDEAIDQRLDLEKMSETVAKLKSSIDVIDKSTAPDLIKKIRQVQSGQGPKGIDSIEFAEGARPVRRLLNKIMKAQSLAWALRVPYGKTAVFADKPTRLQKQLPIRMGSFVSQFVNEDIALRAAVDTAGGNDSSFRTDILGYLNPEMESQISGPITPLITVKHRAEFNIEIALQVIGQSGDELLSAASSFYFLPESKEKNPLQQILPEGLDLPTDPVFALIQKRKLTMRQNATELDQVRNPVKFEPAKIALDKPLGAIMQKAGVEALLSIPDQLVASMTYYPSGTKSDDLISQLNSWMSIENRDRLLIGRPRHPYFAWLNRADRGAMQELLRSPFGPPPSLDDLAVYASKQSDLAGASDFESTWLSLGLTGSGNLMSLQQLWLGYGRRASLKVWASLNRSQRDALRTGIPLDFQILPTQAKTYLSQMAFENETFIDTESGRYMRTPISYFAPSGIPANAYLESKPRPEPSILYECKDGTIGFNDARGCGYVHAQQERGNFLDPSGGYLPMEGALLRPVEANQINTKFKLVPGLSIMLYLQDYHFDPAIPATTWQDLKGPSGDEYRKTLAAYRKSLAGG